MIASHVRGGRLEHAPTGRRRPVTPAKIPCGACGKETKDAKPYCSPPRCGSTGEIGHLAHMPRVREILDEVAARRAEVLSVARSGRVPQDSVILPDLAEFLALNGRVYSVRVLADTFIDDTHLPEHTRNVAMAAYVEELARRGAGSVLHTRDRRGHHLSFVKAA